VHYCQISEALGVLSLPGQVLVSLQRASNPSGWDGFYISSQYYLDYDIAGLKRAPAMFLSNILALNVVSLELQHTTVCSVD
jgi:hypothetical protein